MPNMTSKTKNESMGKPSGGGACSSGGGSTGFPAKAQIVPQK